MISKKKVFTKIQRVFPAEIRNSKVFFGRDQVISKKQKSLDRLWVSSKTKKLYYSGPNNGKSFSNSAPKSRWGGGLFSFLEQKSASKELKTYYFAYFSSFCIPVSQEYLKNTSFCYFAYLKNISFCISFLEQKSSPKALKTGLDPPPPGYATDPRCNV